MQEWLFINVLIFRNNVGQARFEAYRLNIRTNLDHYAKLA